MKFLVYLSLLFSLPADAGCNKQNILRLHPTQMDVGFREVAEKLSAIKVKSPPKLKKYIEKNPAPVVIGPKQQFYIFDRQHLALALSQANVKEMCVDVQADLSNLNESDFWAKMQKRNWVYLFAQDLPATIDQLPADVTGLQDDSYRSLVWQVRKHGGYEKSDAPFAEFQWAHFFRSRVVIGPSDADFEAAAAHALRLVHSDEAKNLPGWTP